MAAVSTSPEGRPRKLKLAPVKGFRKREIARGAKHWLAPGAAVVTDGLGCWSALDEAASDMAQRLETAMAHTLRLGSLAELHG